MLDHQVVSAAAPPVVLFDLDGVLVDSGRAITACINHALAENGLTEQSAEGLKRFIGPPLSSAFAELTREPPDSALVAACVARYRERYAEASLRDTVVIPGIEATLAQLAPLYRLGVATSKPLAFTRPLLSARGLDAFFHVLAGPDLSVTGEDKAQTIAAALRRFGHPRQAVMIGDRSFDVLGARAHGIPAIGVGWGIGDRRELSSAGASALVDRPSDLPAVVARVLRRAVRT